MGQGERERGGGKAMGGAERPALAMLAAAAVGGALGALLLLAKRRRRPKRSARYLPAAATSPQLAMGTLLDLNAANEQHQRFRQFESQFENTVPSMEDLVRLREMNDAAELRIQPAEVLEMLSAGNVRFWTGQSTRPELNTMQRRVEIWQAYPKVAILGCSDSRVPPEIIFDLGLGDVFVVRVAGNAYGTGVAGSLHYAIMHLRVKVVMVLGHEGCGVIRHSQQSLNELDSEPDELSAWFKTVRRGVSPETSALGYISDTRARDREAVIRNVRSQVRLIRSRPHIAQRIATGELIVLGAFYEKRSGMVDFIRCEKEQHALIGPCGESASPTDSEQEIIICDHSRRAPAEPGTPRVRSFRQYNATSCDESKLRRSLTVAPSRNVL